MKFYMKITKNLPPDTIIGETDIEGLPVTYEEYRRMRRIAHIIRTYNFLCARGIYEGPISLSTKISGDNKNTEDVDNTIEIFLQDPDANVPKQVERDMLKEYINEAFTKLKFNERAKYIMNRRFGLNGCRKESLQEIADELGITRERVRQVEKKCLEKMRKNNDVKKLRGFIND